MKRLDMFVSQYRSLVSQTTCSLFRYLQPRWSTTLETIISGTFNFDLDFLDPAQASVTYNYGEDSLSLTLRAGVQQGKLPGIESGTVTATFTRDNILF